MWLFTRNFSQPWVLTRVHQHICWCKILVSFSPFFLFALFRFPSFGRVNVILIARLSALLCEFARHFFLSFCVTFEITGGNLPRVYPFLVVSRPPSPFSPGAEEYFAVPFRLGAGYRRRLFRQRSREMHVRFLGNSDSGSWFRLPSL